MIDPGQMRTPLVYEEERQVGGFDRHGNPIVAWGPVCELWARVRPLRGEEGVRADQVRGTLRHEVVCRYDPRVRSVAGRLRFKLEPGRTMQIDSIVDWEERRVELTIAATERVGGPA